MSDRTKNQIKLIIIDDDPYFCEGVEAKLSQLPTINVVGSFHSAEEALTWLEVHTADVATVDYYMRGLHGIAFIKQLNAQYPNMKLIMITSEDDPYLLRQVLETNAVSALLVKGAFNLLQDAVIAVMRGETRLQPELGMPIYTAERDFQIIHTLTKTQQKCIELAAQGKSIKEIALLQNTTPNTVKDRLLQCRKKFGKKTTEALIERYQKFFPKKERNPLVSFTFPTDEHQQTEKNYVHESSRQIEKKHIIDYEELLSQFYQDNQIVNKIFHTFIKEIDQQERQIIDAHKAQDWETLRALNHRLLSGGKTLRAERLNEACEALRYAIQTKDLTQINQSFDSLVQEIQTVKNYIQDKLK